MPGRRRFFVVICVILSAVTLTLIGSNIIVIIVRGIHSLPDCVSSPETRFAVGLSVRSALISTALCFVLAVPTAYMLTRFRFPLRSAVETLLELTMSLPYLVLGLSLLILFSSPFGKMLKAWGIPVVFSSNGIILAQLVVNLPFAIKLVASAFRGADRKLEYVAGLLGATPGKCLVTVLLPQCKNALISALILIWSRALGEFGATLMLVGVTRMKTETLPASIYLNVSTNHLEGALASAFILLIISAGSLGLANYLTRSRAKRSRYDE
jgi:molybdate transport system permease protein